MTEQPRPGGVGPEPTPSRPEPTTPPGGVTREGGSSAVEGSPTRDRATERTDRSDHPDRTGPTEGNDRADHSDRGDRSGEPSFTERAAEGGKRAMTIAAFIGGALVAVLIGWFLFGEWWIGVVRSTVDGNAFAGFAFGFTVGFVATALSLLFLRFVLARRMPGGLRIVLGALAAIPLAPLVFSLRLALNKSGERPGSLEYQMLVDGRGYQSGVATGALIAAVLALGLGWWLVDRRRRKSRERDTAAR